MALGTVDVRIRDQLQTGRIRGILYVGVEATRVSPVGSFIQDTFDHSPGRMQMCSHQTFSAVCE